LKKVLQLVRKSTLSFLKKYFISTGKVLYLFPKRSLTFSKGSVPLLTRQTAPLPFIVAQNPEILGWQQLRCLNSRYSGVGRGSCQKSDNPAYVCNQIFTHCKYCVHTCAVLLPSVWKFTCVLLEIYFRTCASIFRYVYRTGSFFVKPGKPTRF